MANATRPNKAAQAAAQADQDVQSDIDAAVYENVAAFFATDAATKAARAEADRLAGVGAQTRVDILATLAKLSHDGKWNESQIDKALDYALLRDAGNDPAKVAALKTPATATKKSILKTAMLPGVCFQVPGIISRATDAWDQEDGADDQPLRSRHKRLQFMVVNHLRRAAGKTDSKGKVVEKPAVFADHAAMVADSVNAKTRAPKTPKLAPDLPADATPRDVARAKVATIVAAVETLKGDYPAALDTIQTVLDALAKCTGDRLLPAKPAAPPAATTPKAAPAEPVAGAADIDDAMGGDDDDALSAILAMQQQMAAAIAKLASKK